MKFKKLKDLEIIMAPMFLLGAGAGGLACYSGAHMAHATSQGNPVRPLEKACTLGSAALFGLAGVGYVHRKMENSRQHELERQSKHHSSRGSSI